MIIKRFSIILSLLTVVFCSNIAAQTINLSGEWQFIIDRNDVGEKEGWYKSDFRYNDNITLPSSMPVSMKGDDPSLTTPWVGAIYDSSFYYNPYMKKYQTEGNVKFPFFLTPQKHYVGKAWYKRTVNIENTKQWQDAMLYLERPHITSHVWINGQKLESQNSLSVPHAYKLSTLLKKGSNTIVICIDNDPDKVNVGRDSHSVTDQTQGCWNGIVGDISLRQASPIKSIKTYPDVDKKEVKVVLSICGLPKGKKATLKLSAEAIPNTGNLNTNTPKTNSKPIIQTFIIKGTGETSQIVSVTLPMGDDMLLWDEFTPNVYRLTASINHKPSPTNHYVTYFGMRKMEIRGKMFYINGNETLLRGNVDNCLFPLTGFPPTDLESWLTLLGKQKSWGINHIRFHSYCPPEAAFLAADMLGIYLQPEGPSWPNHGVKLGRGEYIDTYLFDEAKRICDEYGNHPSFTFFAFGNEPAGDWVRWCNEHIDLIKQYDPRHLYAGFSVGGGWAWQPKTEYTVKAGARGLAEWARRAPESMADFSDKIAVYNGKDMPGTPITVPFVTHEMGQWCAFPNFDEIKKYTGVNQARNFEVFRDILKDNGMESRAKDFLLASGKLQALCYKYELERLLRTPNYAGYQLLALNDYSGQGSALVGVTDVFFDEKGYITRDEFREFCSPIVPLAKFPKFTYSTDETFEAELLVSNHSPYPVTRMEWKITDQENHVLAKGADNHPSINLSSCTKAQKLTLHVDAKTASNNLDLGGTNHWDFWVYPTTEENNTTDIYITDSLDAKAQQLLQQGGKVLICAAGKVTYGKEVVQQFLPVFWNTSWFKMKPPHTTGLFIEKDHPVFQGFPTDEHSDLQWWELVNRAQVMQFTDFPKDFQPIVQSIDTWFVSRKIGMLFEAKIANPSNPTKPGRLMMTTMDITRNLTQRHVARTMRQSIINYMRQDTLFQPRHTVTLQRVADLFTKVAGEVNMFTNDSPDELKPVLK